MFNLFRKKPILADLIPDRFVDIHSHILPGIDDGAKNVEESLKLISEMKKLGFSKIIGTPHTYRGMYENTNETIKNSYKLLSKNLPKNINVSYASEYMLDVSLIEKAMNRSLLCIKKNYVLIEMGFLFEPINLYEIIFKISLNGYIPVLAHPERYLFLHDDFNKYHKLKNLNCKFQINFLSVIGGYGKKVLNITDKLLKNNLVDFSGTDIHNMNHIMAIKNTKIKIKEIDRFKSCLNNNQFFK
tara:strand:+ start:64 stop:792 length:729 start_codon:yes stop_codon:yes gene_type:complete